MLIIHRLLRVYNDLLLVLCVQDEDSVEDVCKQIIKQWTECLSRSAAKRNADDGIYVALIHSHSQSQKEKVQLLLRESVMKVGSIWANLAKHPPTGIMHSMKNESNIIDTLQFHKYKNS